MAIARAQWRKLVAATEVDLSEEHEREAFDILDRDGDGVLKEGDLARLWHEMFSEGDYPAAKHLGAIRRGAVMYIVRRTLKHHLHRGRLFPAWSERDDAQRARVKEAAAV